MCENSGEGDISDIIQVTLKPGTECYCTPSYSTGCQWGELISNVNLEGESISLDNTSACSDDDYGDYTTEVAQPDLVPGETYSISISTTYSWTEELKILGWIDYNLNGTFEPSEQIASTGSNGMTGSSQTFEFTVPNDATPGDYRMRVRMVYDWAGGEPLFTACSFEGYGETEDYTVSIIDLDVCSGAPAAGTPDDTEFNVCPASPFTISVSDASDPAAGLT